MGPYCVIACDNSGNWYAYQADEDGQTFDSRLAAEKWGKRQLNSWVWHVAQNA